jgi:hypothetical protein
MAIFGLIVAAGAGIAGYVSSKDFTMRKLRFVDAAQSPAAPWIAGGVVALVAAPVFALLPLVTLGTAVVLGAGVALGVKSAQRDRHLLP